MAPTLDLDIVSNKNLDKQTPLKKNISSPDKSKPW